MILKTKNQDHLWMSQEHPLNFLGGHGGDGPLQSKLGCWQLAHSFILTIQIHPKDKKSPDPSWKSKERPHGFLGGEVPFPSKLGGWKLAHSFILTIQIDLLDGVRKILLPFLDFMEETDHFQVSKEAENQHTSLFLPSKLILNTKKSKSSLKETGMSS